VSKPDSHRRIRTLLEEGLPQTEIVKRLKVSKSTVSRVAIAMRGEHRDARAVIDDFVRSPGASLESDVAARCEALRVCSGKLVWSCSPNTDTAPMAAPQLARQFDRLLEELKRSAPFEDLTDALLADLARARLHRAL
jgi:hypothetical protein